MQERDDELTAAIADAGRRVRALVRAIVDAADSPGVPLMTRIHSLNELTAVEARLRSKKTARRAMSPESDDE
jgi:hypothetical protein